MRNKNRALKRELRTETSTESAKSLQKKQTSSYEQSFSQHNDVSSLKKKEISIMNALLCLAVIFIHVTSYPITSLPPDTASVRLLFFFQKLCGAAVYGFIFLSGLKLFLKDTSKIRLGKYYLSRITKIYVPYLILTVVYYLFEVNRGYFNFSLKELFLFLINGNVECHLYFVVIIMQFYLLLPLWRLLLDKTDGVCLAVSVAVLNVLFVYKMPYFLGLLGIKDFAFNDRLFTSYLFFWIFGCLCGRYYDAFKAFLKKHILSCLALFFVLLLFDTVYSHRAFTGKSYYAKTELIHLSYCFSAILVFFAASMRFADFKSVAESRLINLINGASYEIYLVHILVLHIVTDLTDKYLRLGVLKMYAVRFLLVYAVSISVCVLYKKIRTLALKR